MNDVKKISDEEFFSFMDGELTKRGSDKVVLTAEFRDVTEEAKHWIGFKGRVLKYNKEDGMSGYRIIYRKTFTPGSDYTVELRQQVKKVKAQFIDCSTLSQLPTDFCPGKSKQIPNMLELTQGELSLASTRRIF